VRGGFAEVDAKKVIVLAEEAIPMADFDVAALDRRLADTEEDLGHSQDRRGAYPGV